MISLRPHQRKVREHLRRHGGVLALHGTGTGKTLTSAAAIKDLLQRKIVKHVVVLTKKSAVTQFRNELLRFWPQLPASVVVTTHHTFFRSNPDPRTFKDTLLVLDESHEFTNVKTAGTERLLAMAQQCKRRLLLTATAIVNNVDDLNVQLALARGQRPLSNVAFARADIRDLARQHISVHLVDKNKDPHFPALAYHDVSVRMSAPTAREYARRLKAPLPFSLHLRQLSLGVEGSCEKCRWVQENVARWIQRGEGKVVVYTAFIENGAHILSRLFAEIGVNTLLIDGSTSTKQRQQMATYFNTQHEGAQSNQRARIEDAEPKRGTLCGEGREWFERHHTGRKGAFRAHFTRGKRRIRLKPEERAHYDTLRIPPAWRRAKVCVPNQKLQWVALDGKGRWQYRYSQEWNEQQEYTKVQRLQKLTPAFWEGFERGVARDLRGRWTETKLLALAAKIMQECHFRPGWDDESDHFGLTTLRNKHYAPKSGFKFIGKSGKTNVCRVKPPLSTMLAQLRQHGKPNSLLFEVGESAISARSLRAYLQTYGEIRSKDFRTYFANYTLLHLLRGFPPLQLNRTQRARALAQAYEAIAAGLNNTPAVSKSSYVFTGFSVLYLLRPALFESILRQHESKETRALLPEFVKVVAALDWRALLEHYAKFGDSVPFEGNANVLLITNAGAESIDLKGVRHVVLMDPTWTAALEDQIVGRAQRYHSHDALPKAKRHVNVWRLFLDHPRGQPAAERRVAQLAQRKREELERAYAQLKSVSI